MLLQNHVLGRPISLGFPLKEKETHTDWPLPGFRTPPTPLNGDCFFSVKGNRLGVEA